mmetsp:Transcript_97177/g.217778  ORF Transcript_97177/g.217778 Transcript_97177/m.217778 type:complete len:234 (-) Transcript_97177:298-999(-)
MLSSMVRKSILFMRRMMSVSQSMGAKFSRFRILSATDRIVWARFTIAVAFVFSSWELLIALRAFSQPAVFTPCEQSCTAYSMMTIWVLMCPMFLMTAFQSSSLKGKRKKRGSNGASTPMSSAFVKLDSSASRCVMAFTRSGPVPPTFPPTYDCMSSIMAAPPLVSQFVKSSLMPKPTLVTRSSTPKSVLSALMSVLLMPRNWSAATVPADLFCTRRSPRLTAMMAMVWSIMVV